MENKKSAWYWIENGLWLASIAFMWAVDWKLGIAILLYDIQRAIEIVRSKGYKDIQESIDRMNAAWKDIGKKPSE
jgi:hypothetical protein